MHLGINAVRFTRQFTGVGRYMECVLKEWSEMEVPFEKITLYTHTPLVQERLAFPLERYDVKVIGRELPDPIWEWRYLRPQARNLDVLFCPSYTVPFGYSGKCLVTNLGPAENTWGSYHWWMSQAYETLYKYSTHRANEVCACSQAVKRRLINVYGIPPEKITVTYLAASEAFRPIADRAATEEARRRFIGRENPFILFVGKLARRHYISNLLKAFAAVKKSKHIPHLLVLVGPDYLNLNVAARARKLGIADSVIHIDYVPHKDLPALYNAAEVFIFPASEAEGFGIPVIEAMACGTPVITVNQGSLREFAPGAAYLAPSSAVGELRGALEKMIFDPDLRRDLAAKGLERAKTITWRVTAEKTMSILWQLAQDTRSVQRAGGRNCEADLPTAAISAR
jgi:glycosyltransferase involved in cell wall biosynthesis